MGIFSKTKTYIESTTVSVHEELPDTVKQSVLTSIIQDRSIGDDLIANTLNSLGTKVKPFFRYGKDNYYHGLPEGSLEYPHAGASTVQRVIEDIEGEAVSISFMVYSAADSTYFGYDYLLNTRGWDRDTNVIGIPPGSLVGEVLLEHTEWLTSSSIRIHYIDSQGTKYTEDTITETAVLQGNYYHTGYVLNGTLKYFYYFSQDNTYDVLHVSTTEKEQVYFPIVPFIRDGEDLSVDLGSEDPLFITSRKLLRKIGLNFEELGSSIQENPDIDQVDHAYLVVMAPLQSEHIATQEYLFEYFFNLYQNQIYNLGDFTSWVSLPEEEKITTPPINLVEVKETENDSNVVGNYHIEFGFHYIESTNIVGTIKEGKVGSIERETVISPSVTTQDYKYETSYMLWRKQITETEYTELKVVGLKHVNHVYKDKHIDTTLELSLTDNEDDFNIPINYNILKGMTLLRQTDVLNDAIRLCFNSVEIQKLEWYQTGAFKVLIIVVAAIITVWTQGAGGQALSWAVAITGSTSVALNFAVAVLLVASINVGVGYLIDFIGAEKVAILQLIYSAYRLYQGDFTELTGEALLQLQSGIIQGFNFYINNRSHAIMNAQDILEAEQEEQQAELDELIEAFPQSYLDPMTLLDFSTSLAGVDESPSQYYFARIHSGNIGAYVFDEIEYFVDNNLQLDGVTSRNALDIL